MRNAGLIMVDLPRSSPRALNRRGFARSISHGLCLAAAPAFLLMALITHFAPSGMICSAMPEGFSLSGMVPMYLLMSVFHLPSWLKLMSGGGL